MHAMSPVLLAVCVPLVLTVASDAPADLTGASVSIRLETATGEALWHIATVGPGVELEAPLAEGRASAALDLERAGFSFTVVNRWSGNELNPDGLILLDLRGFTLAGLERAGRAVDLVLVASTFPTGTFDGLIFASGGVSWKAPELLMPGKSTLWRARWTFAPQPGPR